MTQNKTQNPWGAALILGALIGGGLVSIGVLHNQAIHGFKAQDRTVIVRGLSERIVKSNSATWTLPIDKTETTSQKALAELEKKVTLVKQFLKDQGIQEGEIKEPPVAVQDKSERSHPHAKLIPQYQASQEIVVHSKDVDKIEKAYNASGALSKKGFTFSAYKESVPEYTFDNLEELRPEMLAQAIASARRLGEQLAKDAGGSLGTFKNVRQGSFEILPPDGSADHRTSQCLEKKMRLVTTVEYGIQQ